MKYSVTNIICKLGLIGCLFSGLYGCYSLDEEVYSEFVSDDFFQNIEQLQTAAMGMYLPYSRANTFEYHFLTLTSMQSRYTMTADGIMSNASIYGIDNAFKSLATVWECTYQAINRANTIIANAHKAEGDPDIINWHIAEAKFIRAWSYYNLAVLFGDVPLHVIPVKNISQTIMPKSPIEDIYAVVVDDLKFACDNLPVEWTTTEPGRVTKKAAITLLGKVYLTMAGYPLNKTEYYEEAAKVLEDIAVRPYKYNCALLDDIEDVYDVNNKNNPELLFVISSAREGAMSWATALHFYFSGPRSNGIMTGPAPGCSIGWKISFSENLYNLYEPTDDRRTKIWAYSYICDNGSRITYNVDKDYRAPGRGIALRKYVDTEATSNVIGLCDRIIYRYAETLLLAAEAYANIGELQKALVMLNKVRARSNARTYSYGEIGSKEQLLELIYTERSLELCGEFSEIFDIRRWNKVEENFNNHSNRQMAQFDSKFNLYPIPSTEMLYNTAIKENNPGW